MSHIEHETMNVDESVVSSASDSLGSSSDEDPRVIIRVDHETGEETGTDHDEPHPQAGDNATNIDTMLSHARMERGAALNVSSQRKEEIRELNLIISTLNAEKAGLKEDFEESALAFEQEKAQIYGENQQVFRTLRLNLEGSHDTRDGLSGAVRDLNVDNSKLRGEITNLNARLRIETAKKTPVDQETTTQIRESEDYHRQRHVEINAARFDLRWEIRDLKEQLKLATQRGDKKRLLLCLSSARSWLFRP